MSWAKLALLVGQIVLLVLQKAQQDQLLDQGETAQLRKFKDAIDAMVAKADAAAASVDVGRVPDSGTDPFLRD